MNVAPHARVEKSMTPSKAVSRDYWPFPPEIRSNDATSSSGVSVSALLVPAVLVSTGPQRFESVPRISVAKYRRLNYTISR